MRHRSFIPLVLVLTFVSIEVCQAQLVKRIKQAAERAASRVVERKVETEVEKAMERQVERSWIAIFGEQTDAQGNPVDFSKIMGSMNMDVATEEIYEFDSRAEMEITGTDEKGKAIDPMTMHAFTNQQQTYTAIKLDNSDVEEMLMIFDQKNNATIMLMENEGEKSSIAYSIDWEQLAGTMPEDEDENGQTEKLDFRKTGNTKTILGHACEEYELETEEYKGNYWVTKEPLKGAGQFWGNNSPFFSQKLKGKQPQMDNLPEGNILEMHYSSKTDKTNMIFEIKDLDENASKSILMVDYPNMMMMADAEDQ